MNAGALQERRRITVQGIVQGVGFRPFVFGLAQTRCLSGRVWNNGQGVIIDVTGSSAALDNLLLALKQEAPPLAMIEQIDWKPLPLNNAILDFTIIESKQNQPDSQNSSQTFISPDVSICDDCLAELRNPKNRRYGYPFINCTQCGPRFTIIQDLPYDRYQTTMQPFQMCKACQQEYDNPADRRFHAQPNACADCGPQITLATNVNDPQAISGTDALQVAQKQLIAGGILAIKGLGGYHLVCDARNEAAVQRLRQKKVRADKPFALMAHDLAVIEKYCQVSEAERALLTSRQRPIVLLRITLSVKCE